MGEVKCNNIHCNAFNRAALNNNCCQALPVKECGNYVPANVINIGDKDDKATSCSVKDMLHNAIQGIEQESRWNKKAILLFLDEKDGYNIRTMCAGFPRHPEMISLLQLTIIEQANLMGFPSK
jgi:hypothetical protein